MSADDTTYNGWANYATWRVMLEVFDGYDASEDRLTRESAQEYVEEYIEATSSEGLARDYAMAFLNDVNWSEIADAVNEPWKTPDPDADNTLAEEIAARYSNDGREWIDADGIELEEFLVLMRARCEWRDGRGTDVRRYTLADGSAILLAGDCWDVGFADCWCSATGITHEERCPSRQARDDDNDRN